MAHFTKSLQKTVLAGRHDIRERAEPTRSLGALAVVVRRRAATVSSRYAVDKGEHMF
jgi:hypothetical protein